MENEIVSGINLCFEDGRITALSGGEIECNNIIDAQGCYICAGFIDIHTHGGGGADFMDGGTEPILQAMRMHLSHGTTTIYPTGLTASKEVISSFLMDVKAAASINDPFLPHIGGVHLEGPYFAPSQAGAQNPDYLRNPDPAEYNEWFDIGNGLLKRISFAPELSGALELCDALSERNIISAMAHSDAVYEDILPAYERGCRLVTHLYSAMNGVVRRNAYRKLGMVESAFLLDEMVAEIIADGCHLPAELLKMIYRIMGPDRLILVTDSMRGAGMPDGPSVLGRTAEGVDCIIEDGVAKMPDRTCFAGSVATADRLVRTMYKQAGVPLVECVKMITATPARVMGLKNKGSLKVGYDSDIVIFDDDISIKKVIVSNHSEI